jgi:hypothetical protein
MLEDKTQHILDAAVGALEQTTGLKARALVDAHIPGDDFDALLEIGTPKRKYLFAAEVRAVDRFETPALIKARGARGPNAPILVAPYITRETAGRCKELQLPFIDTAGNAYIQAEGLLVYVVGNHRRIDFAPERYRALTPAGLQLTFALLCRPDLLNTNYRAIAAAAKVALGTVGPAMKDLQDRKLLQIGPNGTLRFDDPHRVLDDWVARYPTTLRPKLNARRFEADPEMVQAAHLTPYRAYWGGEAAADRLTHMLRPANFTIYTATEFARFAAVHRLRARPNGNVEILDAFWNLTLNDVPLDIVPPPLVYADLMATKDGRNIEVANLIYEKFIEPKFH